MAKGTKNKRIEQAEATHVLDAVKDLDLTKVIGEVGSLQISVQTTLAGLSSSLTTKIQNLEQIDTAIALKEQRLKELYGVENMAITLDEMKAQREEEDRQYTEQKAARNKAWLEEEAERAKRLKRDADEQEYSRTLATKKWQDTFDAEVVANKRNEQTRQEILHKGWADREGLLKTKEQYLAELQKQVDGFDARLKAEVARTEAVTTASVKREYTHQIELLKKDSAAEAVLHGTQIAAQEKAIIGLNEQIGKLQVQLTEARKDAKEVATQALQSASGRQVADALQKVVGDQAPKSGK